MPDRDLKLKLFDRKDRLQPETLPASRLADLLRVYEAAVVAAMPEAPEEDAPAVCLTEIGDGCVQLKTTHGMGAVDAAISIKESLRTQDYSQLPAKAQSRLAELSRLLVGWQYRAILSGLTADDAEISADRPVPEPKAILVRNRTVIYGVCERVGGQQPKASIRLFSTSRQIDVNLSQKLACELGQRLYDSVGIEGIAISDLSSGEIVSFHGDALVPYAGKNADPLGAMKRIAALSGGTWEDVDPNEYVRESRDEE